MAVVNGPLMSLDASGTVAETLVYGHWKGRNVVRQRVVPNNPKSAAQTGQRSMFAFLTKHWSLLSGADQATYDDLAESQQITAFNAYVQVNLDRWQQNKAPSETYPAEEAATPLTVSDMTLTGYAGYATISVTPSGATAIGGIAIFRDTAEITSPNWANCVAVVEADGANAVLTTDSPLDADTYHYRAAIFTDDGQLGTVIADDTAVVT